MVSFAEWLELLLSVLTTFLSFHSCRAIRVTSTKRLELELSLSVGVVYVGSCNNGLILK